MLRSLKQAQYSPDNVGHFGLAQEAYAHFTSPIRRYPDLLVHRAIRHLLINKSAADFKYSEDEIFTYGEHCSMTGRRADEATRDAVSWLKCEYMMDKVGDEFNGIISSVTSFGLFVELNEIYVEGLVHVTALNNDYYHYDPAHHRLRGEHTGKMYRLGDKIQVMVVRVDLDDRKIDFELTGDSKQEDAFSAPRKKGRKTDRRKEKTSSKKKSTKKKASKKNNSKKKTATRKGEAGSKKSTVKKKKRSAGKTNGKPKRKKASVRKSKERPSAKTGKGKKTAMRKKKRARKSS
jgi:ribonuclease R